MLYLHGSAQTYKVERNPDCKNGTTVGLGAGQVSRVDAVHMALRKGGENVEVVFLPQMLFSHLEIALMQLKTQE